MGILRNPIRSPLRSPLYGPLAGKWGGGSLRPDLSIIAKYQALGAQAFLHDFSRTDLTFQEATGQTLADDAGEAVALALEMGQIGSGTLAAKMASQPELIVNGGPFTNTTGITLVSSTPSIAGGVLTLTGGRAEWPLSGLTVGKIYEAQVRVRRGNGVAQRIQSWTWATVPTTAITASFVEYTYRLAATATSGVLRLYADALSDPTSVMDVESVSVKEIPGYHGIQSGSTGARPTRQAGGILTRDGSDDNLLSTLVGGAAGNTYATKIIAPATVSALQVLAGFGAAASIGRFALGINTSGNLCALVGADTTSTIVAPGTDVRGQTGVAALVEDGANVFLYWNGAQVFTKALNGAPSTAVPYRLGAFNNNGTAGSFTTASARLETAQQAAWSPAEIAQLSSYWNSLP